MNTQEGLVVYADAEKAVIAINRESSCGGNCGMCNAGCSQKYKMEVKNTLSLALGDTVILTANTAGVLFLAFISYILPLMIAIVVYGLSRWEGLSAAVLVLGFLLCIFIGNRLARFPFFKTRIEKK